MEQIIVGFSTHKKFNILSWLIKKVEKTDYSHVYVKFYSQSLNRWIIYQASGTKVNFVGTVMFDKDNVVIKEFSITISEDTKIKTLQYCIDNVGTPYGWKQLIGIGYTRLFRLFNKEVSNPLADGSKTQICAELVGHILKECLGYDIENDLDTIGPKGIYEYVSKI